MRRRRGVARDRVKEAVGRAGVGGRGDGASSPLPGFSTSVKDGSLRLSMRPPVSLKVRLRSMGSLFEATPLRDQTIDIS